jgi:phosphonoacetaldehyde hydrolase
MITQMPEVAKRWEKAKGRPPKEQDVEAMFDRFIPIQVECIARYADLIPGCLETIETLRGRGLKIGSNTGYTSEMMEVLLAEAKRRGYEPDSTVCASDVPAGRPAPWMSLENMKQLGVYPVESLVKIDDTVPGIEEGLNAGMWTIGLTKSGNEIGCTEEELKALPEHELNRRLEVAYQHLSRCGAHYVVETIADIVPCLDAMERRLAVGDKP